jgi:hypothetical protein
MALYLSEVFAVEVGCPLNDLACFQAKPIETILRAADKAIAVPLDLSEAIMKWAPVITGTDGEGRPEEAKAREEARKRGEMVAEVDGGFKQQPLAAFSTGEILKVPIIAGSNSQDGVLFGWAISSVPISFPFFSSTKQLAQLVVPARATAPTPTSRENDQTITVVRHQ